MRQRQDARRLTTALLLVVVATSGVAWAQASAEKPNVPAAPEGGDSFSIDQIVETMQRGTGW